MATTAPQSVPAASPRQVANKSDKRNLLAAIRLALGLESAAVRRNTQTFNRNRYAACACLPDYDALKDEARAIKERSLADLPELLAQLEAAVRARGGHFHLARDRHDACRYITEVCLRHDARLVVKGKSMTSEEVGLNRALEAAGIEVAETDLAEFILQVADEQPSHIIAPALHYSRERISALFKRKFATDLPLDTGEELTRFARERLREKFLHADVGITGANFVAADSGTLVLVESEGNIRMTTLLPPLHIAIAGVEKVVPSRADLGPFLELLAASGTGQPLTSYTSIISPPLDAPAFALPGKSRQPREFHLVLLDNGRLGMRDDPVLKEALYCIRCSACLNSCANFQTVGGHAFGGETYSGGIGGSWEAGTGRIENARFSELCTGCSRCVPQCPVRIDVPWLNENLRDRLNRADPPSAWSQTLARLTSAPKQDRDVPAAKIFFGNYHWFAKWGTRLAPLTNWFGGLPGSRRLLERLVGLDRRRALPPFARQSLVDWFREQRRSHSPSTTAARVALFADVYTNYGLPSRGMATVKVLRAAGVDVVVTESLPAGRAPLSQGMIATARRHARAAAEMLRRQLDDGCDIVVVEPSILALFRRDYRHLLDDTTLVERLRTHCFDPVEYLGKLSCDRGLDLGALFDVTLSPVGKRLYYHAHCQARTIGADAAKSVLSAAGFDVATSSVECCGMAGSFGYKKDFYELSMAVGEDLFCEVRSNDQPDGPRALIASGTSCTEQLHAGLGREVLHPMELLAAILAR